MKFQGVKNKAGFDAEVLHRSGYSHCMLCERACGVDREAGELGYCRQSSKIKIARAALHFWEEPIISGSSGSGAIFFSGCSLGCIYCQNKEISRDGKGSEVSASVLADVMLRLQNEGAHNINLVTPTHAAPTVIESVSLARHAGLDIPIVYNTAAYESESTLESLRETVDVFLPDLKYYRPQTASALSAAASLPEISRKRIEKMVEIAGNAEIGSDGIMKRGVIVRILLLPAHVAEAKLNLKYLYEKYADKIYISLMSQYTPSEALPPPLNRRVTRAEYGELVDYAVRLGVKNAFIQSFESAEKSFIPEFDNTGVPGNE